MKQPAVFNWSGGKDSALALHQVLQGQDFEVVSLLTTVNFQNRRSSMHGIPIPLLQAQSDSIGIPLYTLELLPGGEMQGYEIAMQRAVDHFRALGVRHFIFGDIFLHDVRSYREEKLSPHGIEVVEPLWNKTTDEVMEEFLRSGLQTIIVTTNAEQLGEEYLGQRISKELISGLPLGVDPCGENGEYHTFCFDGPIFQHPVSYSLGEPIRITNTVNMKDGTHQTFHYCCVNLDMGRTTIKI
ncbi:MAG: diphthine--ammonia ligase [Bacteroidales bacterium]